MLTRRTAIGGFFMVGGCGLLNALDKVKGLSFDLPKRSYTVDTANPNWRSLPPGEIPPLPCGSGQLIADCCTAPVDCTRTPLVCEAERCALKFNYEQVHPVNLAKEVPELASSNGMIFTQVLLTRIDLEVDNQLNISTPPVNLFVAPMNVTSPSGGGAQRLVTIPRQAPRTMGVVGIDLDQAAQLVFSNFARDFQTPFNIIMSTSVLLKSDDPFPMGSATFKVGGRVEAKL